MTIITLIHGTFAHGAEWVKETSPLAVALKEHLSDEVRIEPFPWSGRNLHFMRRRAATDLQAHILKLRTESPDATQFLIAHSHGGNVALYSLADPDVMTSVNGVVCLSTPFIHVRRRQFAESLDGVLSVFVLVIVWLCLYPLSSNWPWRLQLLAALDVAITIALFMTGSRLLSKLIVGDSKAGYREVYRCVINSFSLPHLSSQRLLILRAPGDEASAFLGASVFASWVFGRLSRSIGIAFRFGTWLHSVNAKLGIVRRLVWASFCFSIFGLFVYEFHDLSLPVTDWRFIIIVISFVMGFGFALGFQGWGKAIQFAYIVLLMPWLFLCSFFATPFGFDSGLVATLVEFSAETTPTGRFTVSSLEAPTARGLWHSLPYEDPGAFEEIVAWINERLARRAS